jgi:hypothetical protein
MTTRHSDAEQFAAAVDHDARAVPVVAALGALATQLRTPAPAPGFKTALRARLMTEAAALAPTTGGAHVPAPRSGGHGVASHAARAAQGGWTSSTVGSLVAGGLSIAVAAGGVTVATNRAQPGDLFYGLKNTKHARPVAAVDAAAGATLLEQAQGQVDELRRLLTSPLAVPAGAAYAQLQSTIRGLDADLQAGVAQLLAAARAGSAQAAQDLARLTAQTRDALTALLPKLPARLRAEAQAVLHDIAVARAWLPTLPGHHVGPPSTGPVPGTTTPAPRTTTPGPGSSTTPGVGPTLPTVPPSIVPTTPRVTVPPLPRPSVTVSPGVTLPPVLPTSLPSL